MVRRTLWDQTTTMSGYFLTVNSVLWLSPTFKWTRSPTSLPPLFFHRVLAQNMKYTVFSTFSSLYIFICKHTTSKIYPRLVEKFEISTSFLKWRRKLGKFASFYLGQFFVYHYLNRIFTCCQHRFSCRPQLYYTKISYLFIFELRHDQSFRCLVEHFKIFNKKAVKHPTWQSD